MLKFIPRTAYSGNYVRRLHVACECSPNKPKFDPQTGERTSWGACYYCLYRNSIDTMDHWIACVNKHGCNDAQFPFIEMMSPINDEVDTEPPAPGHTYISYSPTGVFRQVVFEGQPYYIQLYVATNSDGKCNASCWWHGWRLSNKRTWRQCARSHKCLQNGSLWVLMAPTNPILYREFLKQY